MYVSSVDAKFEGCRLIVPSVSVGNVAQLAVDLLISSLRLRRVGWLRDPALLPLVGNDAFDHTPSRRAGYLHTAAEVYCSEELKLVVVQLRAPIAKGCSQSFVSNLIGWTKESLFSEVVVLTSSEAYERRDSQLVGPPFRFLLSEWSSELNADFTERLKWQALEPRTSTNGLRSCDSSSGSHDPPPPTPPGVLTASEIFLPGSGFAKLLYTESAAAEVRMVVLIGFTSQGDNRGDAVLMASQLNQWLQLRQTQAGGGVQSTSALWLTPPSSWELMFGGPTHDELF